MNKFLLIWLPVSVLVLTAFLVVGCSNEEPEQLPVTVMPTPEKSRFLTYGDLGALNSWPGEGADQIAEVLTAKNFYIIMDGSRSMDESGCSGGEQKLSVAKSSLMRFVDKIPLADNIGLFAFDSESRDERVPLGPGTHTKVKETVLGMTPGGMTPLSKAITTARESLTEQAKRQLGYGEYNIVVVTDGQANNRQTLGKVIRSLLEETPIIVHTIGFCLSSSHTLNEPGYTLYTSTDNPKGLDEGLQQVLAESPSFIVEGFK